MTNAAILYFQVPCCWQQCKRLLRDLWRPAASRWIKRPSVPLRTRPHCAKRSWVFVMLPPLPTPFKIPHRNLHRRGRRLCPQGEIKTRTTKISFQRLGQEMYVLHELPLSALPWSDVTSHRKYTASQTNMALHLDGTPTSTPALIQ